MELSEITKKWMDFVQADLEAAEVLFEHPKSDRSWQMVVFHCHEAVEKLLKAILVHQGKEVKKIHDLTRLLELVGIELPEVHATFIEELNPCYPGQRYPDLPVHDPVRRYDRLVAEYYLQKTKAFLIWIKQYHLM